MPEPPKVLQWLTAALLAVAVAVWLTAIYLSYFAR